MDEILTLVLKTYGLVGVLILLPAAAAIFLFRENKLLHSEVIAQTTLALEAQKDRTKDQQARVADTERMMEKLLEIVKEQTALNTEINGVMSRLSESVDKLERRTLYNERG